MKAIMIHKNVQKQTTLKKKAFNHKVIGVRAAQTYLTKTCIVEKLLEFNI